MKVVFMLASTFGIRCLKSVMGLNCADICGVVTVPKQYVLKYGGNNQKTMENSVYDELYIICTGNDISIYEIEKMNSESTWDVLKEWKPDLIIVAGWYHIVGREILSLPSKGVIGLHSSLLPQYRGGAPLVWQMINGEEYAGISLFYLENGTDTGDIIGQRKVKIEINDTIGTLYGKIENEAVHLLESNLPLIDKGQAPRIKQDQGSYQIYPQRIPDDGLIDWNQSSRRIYDFVRAQTRPYPGAFSIYRNRKIKIWSCTIEQVENKYTPGTIIHIDEKNCPVIASNETGTAIKILSCSDETDDRKIEWKLYDTL